MSSIIAIPSYLLPTSALYNCSWFEIGEATKDLSNYLMGYYNQRKPYRYNNSLTLAETENKLNLLFRIC